MAEHTVATLIETVCDSFSQAPLSYGHGTDNAWDEAVALVLHVSGVENDRAQLQQPLSVEVAEAVLELAARRIDTRQPLAYLLGSCRYMGLEFVLQPGVVVPRSPIGYLLVDHLQPWLPPRITRILDLCSGSGCLGILAATLYPDADVTLVEMDQQAAAVATQNLQRHNLADRVQVVRADVTLDLSELAPPYDLIISNPPYVDARDMASLPAEYRAEPAAGLAAGEDGLQVMHAVLGHLPALLSPEGLFVGEIGASAPALLRGYPGLPFIWPDLPEGGEGVFLLEGSAFNSHTAGSN